MAKAAINGGLETDLQTGLAMEAACYAQVRRAGCMSARLSAAVEMITCFPGYLLCLGASVLQFLRRGCRVLVYWCNHARTSSARVCEGVQVVSRDIFPVWPAVALTHFLRSATEAVCLAGAADAGPPGGTARLC